MVLEHNATGEDALRGWLVAAYAANMDKFVHDPNSSFLQEAYERMNNVISPFGELQAKGGTRIVFLMEPEIAFSIIQFQVIYINLFIHLLYLSQYQHGHVNI